MVRGRSWAYGATESGLRFTVLLGSVDRSDAEALIGLWSMAKRDAPHPTLFDTTDLEGFSKDFFDVLSAFVRERVDLLARRVTRLGLVRPDNVVGPMVAGYFQVFTPPCPYSVFADRASALIWLGEDPSVLSRSIPEPTTVARLRAMLTSDPQLAVDALARSLGMSRRSLQRRLSEEGTSFSAEAERARLELAMRLMRSTDQKLAAIAAHVGYGSLSAFSEWFARHTGQAPSRWRAEGR